MNIVDYFSKKKPIVEDAYLEELKGCVTMDEYLIILTCIKRNCPLIKINFLQSCLNKLAEPLLQKVKENIDLFKYYDNNIFVPKLFVETYINFAQVNFTQDQILALNMLTSFFADSEKKIFGFYGFAGTGKTSLIMKYIHYLIENNYITSIALSAPTNIAVDILKSKFKDLNNASFDDTISNYEQQNKKILFTTLHKLLGYKKDLDMDGNMVFLQGKNTIFDDYSIIIIDECSMITTDIVIKILGDIVKLSLSYNVKVIFIGDPAQLPPVNLQETNVSAIFSKNVITKDQKILDLLNFDTITMTQVVRSNDSDVIGLCNEIRKWAMSEIKKPCLKNFKGSKIKYYNNIGPKTDNKWFKRFIEYKKNGHNSIILTWTNEHCNKYNNMSRLILNNNNALKEFEEHDSLIMNTYYNLEGVTKGLYTSEQIKIVDISQMTHSCPLFKETINLQNINNLKAIETKYKTIVFQINKGTTRKYNLWRLGILRADSSDVNHIYVCKKESTIMLEKDKVYADMKIKELIKYYNNYHKDQINTIINKIIKPLWKEYKTIFVNLFANVSYGNSCTTHKAQGANFYNVFIDAHDILTNQNYEESKKCLYTAITRVSNEVHLLL